MSFKQFLRKRSPQIYLSMGIAGFIGATVIAVKKADKVKPVVLQAKEDFDGATIDDYRFGFKTKGDERRYKAKIVVYAALEVTKIMAVPIGLGCISTACIIKSNKAANAKYLEAVGTIGILRNSAELYKKAVAEEVDEETLKKINDKVNMKQIVDQLNSICKSDGTYCEDPETFNRYFSKETSNKFPDGGDEAVLPFLKSKETYFNQLLHTRERRSRNKLGFVSYNEVMDALGFPKIPEGDTAGWTSRNGKGFIDFGIAGAYYADYDGVLDRYNCVINPNDIPWSISGFMLCFNVDPFVIK